jgi:hypothetical protein
LYKKFLKTEKLKGYHFAKSVQIQCKWWVQNDKEYTGIHSRACYVSTLKESNQLCVTVFFLYFYPRAQQKKKKDLPKDKTSKIRLRSGLSLSGFLILQPCFCWLNSSPIFIASIFFVSKFHIIWPKKVVILFAFFVFMFIYFYDFIYIFYLFFLILIEMGSGKVQPLVHVAQDPDGFMCKFIPRR